MELTEYDKELLKIFEHDIFNNNIIIDQNTEVYIAEIEDKFDFVYSGIDWNEKNTKFFEKLDENSNKSEIVNLFFNKITASFPILKNEQIIVLGDYVTNIGYIMNFDFFVKNNKYFFELPQDTYVWFLESKKIINYTFEDELFFG